MKWIHLSEKKPEHGQYCIVVAHGAVQLMSVAWDKFDNKFVWSDGFEYGTSAFDDPFASELATHWMPFPNFPLDV